ncbi:hypothetical protein JCM11251_007986 [Rhodosporidiobolus azoricus]
MPVATRRQVAQQLHQPQPEPASSDKTESLSSTLVGGDSETSNDLSPRIQPTHTLAAQHDGQDSSSDSGADDSDSDDDSSSSSTTSSDADEHNEDPSAHLASLLAKAKSAARLRAQQEKERKEGKRGGLGDGLAGNEEVVRFGVESESESDSEGEDTGTTPTASTSRAVSLSASSTKKPAPPALPPPLSRPLSFSHSASFPTSRRPLPSTSASTSGRIALAQDLGGVLARGEEVRVVPALGSKDKGKGKGKGKEVEGREDRFGQLPLPKLSKKEIRAKQPPTAGPQWFNMPATPLTTELKRDLSALRLSSALDPKKFMRSGAAKEKIGEFFQVGHVINPSTRATTLSDHAKVRKRDFVEDVMGSEEKVQYAKRKTREVLRKGMEGRKRQRAKSGGGGKGRYAMGEGGQRGGGEGGAKRRKV